MKTQQFSFRLHRRCLWMIVAVVPCLFAINARAATASGTFTVSMPVNSPVCTVSTNNATVALPTAGSPNQTLGNYFSTNSITTASQYGGTWVTSAALNQTATISCTTASTPILNFVVQPATGAVVTAAGPAVVYLVDTATTPLKAGAGNMYLLYEQVSINGTAAPFSYANTTNNAVAPYTTTFTTAAVANGTATVVWRPALYSASATTAMGTPAGGSFTSPGQIVINY
jgi:hypothetical protein